MEFQYGLRSKSGKRNLAITIHQFLQDLATISHKPNEVMQDGEIFI